MTEQDDSPTRIRVQRATIIAIVVGFMGLALLVIFPAPAASQKTLVSTPAAIAAQELRSELLRVMKGAPALQGFSELSGPIGYLCPEINDTCTQADITRWLVADRGPVLPGHPTFTRNMCNGFIMWSVQQGATDWTSVENGEREPRPLSERAAAIDACVEVIDRGPSPTSPFATSGMLPGVPDVKAVFLLSAPPQRWDVRATYAAPPAPFVPAVR